MDTEEIRKEILQCVENTADSDLLKSILSIVQNRPEYGCERLKIHDDMVGDYIRIFTNKIVPIICDDMFEVYDEKSGTSYSISDFVCENYRVDDNIAKAIRSNFYYGMTLLKQLQVDYSSVLYDALNKKYKAGDLRLRRTVQDFLQHGNFPLIVTTFGFRVIEDSLTGYEPRWFNPRKRNDIPFMYNNSRIVYHIFGGDEYSHWVYNEQKMLEFVHALHSGDYGAKGLSNYLCGFKRDNSDIKQPLVIGSSLPDWLFRFFMYPLYGDKLKNANGYWLSLSEIEKGLDLFLSRNEFKGQANLRSGNLVDSIIRKATIDCECATDTPAPGKKIIFVSYKRKDGKTPEKVNRIVEIIGNQGYDVWIDTEELVFNDLYWFKIKRAIQSCDIFMPLITDTYLEAFNNSGNVELLTKENKIAEVNVAGQKTNDPKIVCDLPPIAREAYYAIAYNKPSYPVILKDEGLDVTSIEKVFSSNDKCVLPESIFGENGAKNYPIYDDKNPDFFTFLD